MFLHKTPIILRWLYPSLIWKRKTDLKEIYLTFDDGPIPMVTPWVLDILRKWNAKATFFCVGENISKHPEIFSRVISEGHAVGNHTHNHLNGWKTPLVDYFKNCLQADEAIGSEYSENRLFRPPYGRITSKQIKALKNWQIVMWDVLPGDFSSKHSAEEVLQKAIINSSEGSIVVFHDNLKSFDKLKEVLPAYLEHFTEQGYKFKAL